MYANKTSDYKAGDTNVKLQMQTITAMNSMMSAFKLLYGRTDLTIVTGYRTYDQQQSVYNKNVASIGEEKASTQVSKPGASDYHTGLAMYYRIVTSTSVTKFSPSGDYGWVAQNAIRYGFIQRYPTDKSTITGMDGDDALYRYVGLPHSFIMYTSQLSFEEYIMFIKNYRYNTAMLEQELNDITYKVYYYPADSGSTTILPVPDDCTSYNISGNNIDEYIVTAIYN